MRPILYVAAALLMGVMACAVPLAVTPVAAQQAGGQTTCPPTPPPGSQVYGGLVVTGQCTLSRITVHGGITVTSSGMLDLENSTVNGGIVVQPGGELDSGHLSNSSTATFNPSTITGGIDVNNARDLDLDNATVYGSVSLTGILGEPSICDSHFYGVVAITNIRSSYVLFGDPSEPGGSGPTCPGNTVNGSLHVRNSQSLDIESNSISGSVTVDDSRVELAANTIGGSAQCSGVTAFTDGDRAPNSVGGQNTCP